jgi:uncharacterized protein YndB with AHSA1/START domain
MTRILGSLRRLDENRGAVRVEDVYDTDIDDLWSAITEPDRLARWIATVEGDGQVGATVQVAFVSEWEGPARIDVCDAPRRLLVTLEPGTEDEAEIEATLTPDGPRTRLVVDHRGRLLDVLHLHGAGWPVHLEDLHRYLTGTEPSWRARWEELIPAYTAMPISE